MVKEELMKKAFDAIVEADVDEAMSCMDTAAEMGVDSVELLNDGFSAGMNHLGEEFAEGEVYLPELIFASEVMKSVTDRIEEELAASGVKIENKGTFVIGTVEGDVHDIGKGICASLLKTSGFEVHDMGHEVPMSDMVEKALEVNADIIGTSALLTTTMQQQQVLEDLLREKGVRDKFKTMIGGAPITHDWAEKIGADAYTDNATECCNVAKSFVEK